MNNTIKALLNNSEQNLYWFINRDDIVDWKPRPFMVGKEEAEIIDLYSNDIVSVEDLEQYYICLGPIDEPARMPGTYIIDYNDEELAAHLVHEENDIVWLLPDGKRVNYYRSQEGVEVTEVISILNPETGARETVCFS